MSSTLRTWLMAHRDDEREFLHARLVIDHVDMNEAQPGGTMVMLRRGRVCTLVHAHAGDEHATVWVDALGRSMDVPTDKLVPCDSEGNDWPE